MEWHCSYLMLHVPQESRLKLCNPSLKLSTGHVGVINALVSTTDERFVISAGGDAMIRVWDSRDLTYMHTLR